MLTAKLFVNGSSQAVRLPKEYRFAGTEVYAQKIGDTVVLVPKEKAWETFLEVFFSLFGKTDIRNHPHGAAAPLPRVASFPSAHIRQEGTSSCPPQ